MPPAGKPQAAARRTDVGRPRRGHCRQRRRCQTRRQPSSARSARRRSSARCAPRGFRVLGPTVRDGAIVYDDLDSAADLPVGWTDEQDAGTLPARAPRRRRAVRLRRRAALVEAVPASRRASGSGARGATGRRFEVEEEPLDDDARSRFIGVRACELHAIAIQDRVFLGGRYVDRDYAARREGAFVVAVNCFEPGGTCFCVSMGTGPKAEAGYDLALTELLDGEHRFLVEVGSERGAEVLPSSPSPRGRRRRPRRRRRARSRGAAERMGRTIDTTDIRDLLARNLEHQRWDDVADALPDLRQLHDRLPDLLLHEPSRTRPTSTGERRRARPRLGLVLLGRPLVHPRRQRPGVRPLALPPVADAQVRHLARPVRHAPAASAAAAASPGARSGSTSPRSWPRSARREEATDARRLRALLAGRPDLRRASTSDAARAARRLRANVALRATARCSSARASRRTPSTSSGTAGSRSRSSCRPRGPVTIETLDAGEVVGWSWLFAAVPLALRRAGGRRRARDARSTARACAASASADPALGYDLMSALRAGADRAPAVDAAPAAGRLWRRRR